MNVSPVQTSHLAARDPSNPSMACGVEWVLEVRHTLQVRCTLLIGVGTLRTWARLGGARASALHYKRAPGVCSDGFSHQRMRKEELTSPLATYGRPEGFAESLGSPLMARCPSRLVRRDSTRRPEVSLLASAWLLVGAQCHDRAGHAGRQPG
jgi:hypothetical protein